MSNLAMQSLLECARLYADYKMFDSAEYFCDMALTLSICYSNKYYEELVL
jgi:hypothetical protein